MGIRKQRTNALSIPVILPIQIKRLVPINIGMISKKYHFILTMVLARTLDITGILRGGTSMTNDVSSPGMSLFAPTPAAMKTNETETAQMVNARGLSDSIPTITPSCPEQGTARARRNVVIILSRLDSRVLVTSVAMVSHPSPKVMGITARPVRPTTLRTLSARSDSLGRYPVSSSTENAKKKVPTIGITTAMA